MAAICLIVRGLNAHLELIEPLGELLHGIVPCESGRKLAAAAPT